mmetsp:Transcript_1690/g.3819  ORF Transcript_1690/g.3819 Transcript_1690/m.3819 type:complete len:807 (-) Transcript_1690:397-2817(-)
MRFRGLAVLLLLLCQQACATPLGSEETPLGSEELSMQPGVWGEILTLDCEGKLHLAPNSPFALSLDLADLKTANDFWMDKVLQRARDRCPAAQASHLKAILLPSLEYVINTFLTGNSTRVSSLPCPGLNQGDAAFQPWIPSLLEGAFRAVRLASVDAPATCSLATLAAGQGCLLQYHSQVLADTTVFVAADACPNSPHTPFLSVSLSGAGALSFLKPCDAAAECGGLECSPIRGFLEGAYPDSELQQHLARLSLFDSRSDDPQCAASNGRVDPVAEVKAFLLASFFGGGAPRSSRATLCGASLLAPLPLQAWFPDCAKTSAGSIRCAGLGAWDGALPGGGSALSEARKSGLLFAASFFRPAFSAPDGTSKVFGVRGKEGAAFVQLSDRLGLALVLPNLHHTLSALTSILKRVQDCRGDGSALTWTQFFTRFAVWRPEFVLARFSALGASLNLGKPLSDILSRLRAMRYGRLLTPSSCSYERWVSTGQCAALYVGFLDLIAGADLELLANVTAPPLHALSSAIAAEEAVQLDMDVACRGEHCALAARNSFCRDATPTPGAADQGEGGQCGRGLSCQDLVFDARYARALHLALRDPVGDVLWRSAEGQGCCSQAGTGAFGCEEMRAGAACGPLQWRRDLHHYLASLLVPPTSDPPADPQPSSSLALCSFDPAAVNCAWARTQLRVVSRPPAAEPIWALAGLLDANATREAWTREVWRGPGMLAEGLEVEGLVRCAAAMGVDVQQLALQAALASVGQSAAVIGGCVGAVAAVLGLAGCAVVWSRRTRTAAPSTRSWLLDQGEDDGVCRG